VLSTTFLLLANVRRSAAQPTVDLNAIDRFISFGYLTLFRAMLDVSIWLGLCALLGTINGIARLLFWVRQSRDPATRSARG